MKGLKLLLNISWSFNDLSKPYTIFWQHFLKLLQFFGVLRIDRLQYLRTTTFNKSAQLRTIVFGGADSCNTLSISFRHKFPLVWNLFLQQIQWLHSFQCLPMLKNHKNIDLLVNKDLMYKLKWNLGYILDRFHI